MTLITHMFHEVLEIIKRAVKAKSNNWPRKKRGESTAMTCKGGISPRNGWTGIITKNGKTAKESHQYRRGKRMGKHRSTFRKMS